MSDTLDILAHRLFRFFQRIGIDVLPNHFYSPIPKLSDLSDDLWLDHSQLAGIDLNEEGQLKLLSFFVSRFKEEYDRIPLNRTTTQYEYYLHNTRYGPVDGEILYCMIRHYKPRRMIEIGSGNSTYLSAKAILRNNEEDHEYRCDFTVIDPYPNTILKKGVPGLSEIIIEQVQKVQLSKFQELDANDILFIDSSHMLKIGSDVQYEYLEVLPQLNQGVIVHVHDIFIPAEYPKEWVLTLDRFWNEQYLLQAFLMFNDSFEILWAGQYMHLMHSEALKNAFKSYRASPARPGSFWMRRARGENITHETSR
jgi:hypothetical protein